jgi:hypothetical protein
MIARFRVLTPTAALLASACLGFLSQPVEAFKCKPLASPREELKNASAVFVGKVTRVEQHESASITHFEVQTFWKGPNAKTLTVRSGKHLYGYRFTKGGEYLVYAFGKDELETSRCSRTKSVEEATLDLKELGTGKAPE